MDFLVESTCPIQKNFLSALVPHYKNQLGLNNNKAFITILVDDDLGDSTGACAPIYIPEQNLDGYLVVIGSQDLSTMGISLAHELAHVRQYVKGYWRQLGEGYNLWCGKVVGPETHYLNLPWEIDAFKRQELMYRRAIDDLGLDYETIYGTV